MGGFAGSIADLTTLKRMVMKLKRFIEVALFWKVLAGKKRIFSAILLAFFMLLAKLGGLISSHFREISLTEM
jgi:hypothetical protein